MNVSGRVKKPTFIVSLTLLVTDHNGGPFEGTSQEISKVEILYLEC